MHSMPDGFRDVDVIFLFPPGCPPIAELQRDSKAAAKAVVGFATEADAAAVFAMLPGRLKPDSMGRAQKLVCTLQPPPPPPPSFMCASIRQV